MERPGEMETSNPQQLKPDQRSGECHCALPAVAHCWQRLKEPYAVPKNSIVRFLIIPSDDLATSMAAIHSNILEDLETALLRSCILLYRTEGLA
jgi:hypothetical protein